MEQQLSEIQDIEMRDYKEMRDNVRRVVEALDVCWRCQNVTECNRHILGNLVLVWLCRGCLFEMGHIDAPQLDRQQRQRKVLA